MTRSTLPTRSTLSRLATLVLALVMFALALTACTAAHAEGPTAAECAKIFGYEPASDGPAGVLVYDASRSRPGGGLAAEAATLIRDLSERKGSLSVLLVDGEGAKPQWILSGAGLNRDDVGVDTAVHRTAVSRSVPCVERELAGVAPTAPGTDLAEAMRAAAEAGTTSGATHYVIETDGFANTGALNLVDRVNEASVADVVAGLTAAGWDPRFEGASVAFTGIARTYGEVVAPVHAAWLRSLYQALCERSGAATCAVPVADQAVAAGGESERSGAPADAGLALAAIDTHTTDAGRTVVVPGSLLFGPDSAVLAAEADATLVEVAECVRQGATVTVVGHAAPDPAARAGWADELARARADAASARLVELARGDAGSGTDGITGGSAERVSAEGRGDTQPLPGGSAAENRRVEFVIVGGC